MKRVISLLLVFGTFLSLLPLHALAAEIQDSTTWIQTIENDFPDSFSHSEQIHDTEGNTTSIYFDTLGSKTYVEVSVNGTLTQRAMSNPAANKIFYIEYYPSNARNKQKASSGSVYNYSDFATKVISSEPSYDDEISTCAFNTDGWAKVLSVPKNASISGSRPCVVYRRNYDEEPDLHRYESTQVKVGAGAAVSVVVSIVASFITGGVTISTIVAALGSSIVADAITSAITGKVCFSTQKILYAPVIAGVNIFPDAYITKRWVIIHDNIKNKDSFKLDNPYYKYNKGIDASEIAYNAQMADANS